MKLNKKYRLNPSKLTHTVPKSWLNFKTTKELSPTEKMIGQERAMHAIDVGLRIGTRGFNIFAVGEPGSGKTSTLEKLLQERAKAAPVPDDLCYVYNFQEPERPRPLALPAGKGRALAKDMEQLVKELEKMIPRVLSEGSFGHIRAGIVSETRKQADALVNDASKAAKRLDLRIEEDADNLRVLAMKDNEPLDEEAFSALPAAERRKIETRLLDFQEHLDVFTYGRRQLERDHRKRLTRAEVRIVTPIVTELVDELVRKYQKHNHNIVDFLGEVKNSILENHNAFMPVEEEPEQGELDMLPSPLPIDHTRVYQVNVVVDRTNQKGAPVVLERVPTVANLAGYFEYRETQGGLVTDHTMIRAGALHEACGGYLLLQAAELLTHENAWDVLKRTLRHKEVRVDGGFGTDNGRPRIAGMMKPGAAPLNLKVILVGSHDTFYFLKIEDDEFGRLFKIRADFQHTMGRDKETVQRIARFLGKVCNEEGYLPLHQSGVARLIEFSARRAGHKHRMTARRADLLDILAEANAGAKETRARAIRDLHVEEALADIAYREGAMVEAVQREVEEGGILIQTQGATVGQINGIALYDVIGASFGVPLRITARIYAGSRGVVNIDREVRLSGAIHDKGSLILIGYLGGRYAQKQNLALSASITFEQSYDEVDGDSASSAELYALLSALSGVPIQQGIAVTGSVNQLGEIQPIGGVNDKIEGVYRICKIQGLTGQQGVMIPESNVKNLMLSKEVIDAVKQGTFNIWAITSIDQGIEVLTGVSAGVRKSNGDFTEGSINQKVQQRIAELQSINQHSGMTAFDTKL